MDHASTMLYEEWQRSVREYAAMVRNVRTRRISYEELETVTRPYLQRVDAAYAKFKQSTRPRCELCAEAFF